MNTEIMGEGEGEKGRGKGNQPTEKSILSSPLRLSHDLNHDSKRWMFSGQSHPAIGIIQHRQRVLAVVENELIVLLDHLNDWGLTLFSFTMVNVYSVKEASISSTRED